jgi:hypothetical protein
MPTSGVGFDTQVLPDWKPVHVSVPLPMPETPKPQ